MSMSSSGRLRGSPALVMVRAGLGLAVSAVLLGCAYSHGRPCCDRTPAIAPGDPIQIEWAWLTRSAEQPTTPIRSLTPGQLDGRRVQIEGSIVLLHEFDAIREFQLVERQIENTHGFSLPPTEVVTVMLRGKATPLRASTRRVRVMGVFLVRATSEHGVVTSEYLIDDADAVAME